MGVWYNASMAIVKRILLSLLALLLVFEEWLWDVLTVLGSRLSRLLRLARFEAWLKAAPPPVAFVAFAIPLIIVAPLNVVAFWMIARGIILQGVLLEIFAKLLGTLLVARVFALTRPQLMTLRWFAWLYGKITGWLRWAHARVVATAVYMHAQRIKAHVRAFLRQ